MTKIGIQICKGERCVVVDQTTTKVSLTPFVTEVFFSNEGSRARISFIRGVEGADFDRSGFPMVNVCSDSLRQRVSYKNLDYDISPVEINKPKANNEGGRRKFLGLF